MHILAKAGEVLKKLKHDNGILVHFIVGRRLV